jgi:cyclohexanone monooxygenase
VRRQRETTEEERRAWLRQPDWARARRARYAMMTETYSAHHADEDFLSGRDPDLEARLKEEIANAPQRSLKEQLEANFRIMEQVRARVDAAVRDPATAAALKPYYTYGCKRATFHDEFLPTFNRPNVHLIDTSPTGVRRINERGVVHDGVEYPLDVIIFATGFQFMATSTFNMVNGRGGLSLSEKWRTRGTRTYLGLHSRGFPNLFIVTGPQGGPKNINFTITIEAHADYIAWMLSTMRERGEEIVDVREEAEEAWSEHCAQADVATAALRDCISYFNHDGTAKPGSLVYYGGRWDEWRIAAQSTLEPYVFGHSNEF